MLKNIGKSSNGLQIFTLSHVTNSITNLTIVIIIITTIFVMNTEVGKYGFLSVITLLYTKIKKEKKDLMYGYNKDLILGHINGNPGDSYNAIRRILNLNNGTLAYYLRILKKEGLIRFERDGIYKRFYPSDRKIIKNVFELTDKQQNIYKIIKENSKISQKDISLQLGIPQSTVNYHVQIMANTRIIKVEREGKKTKFFIIDEML